MSINNVVRQNKYKVKLENRERSSYERLKSYTAENDCDMCYGM